MRVSFVSALLTTVALAVAGCGDLFEPAAAVVDGEKITVDVVQAEVDEFASGDSFERLAEQGDAAALKREFEQDLLSRLIRRAVLEPEAEARGVAIEDADVQARIEEIEADFASRSAFEEALKEQGLTIEQLRELIYDQLLEENVRAEVVGDLTPSDEELQAYYESNEAEFRETRAQHILVGSRKLADRIATELQESPPDDVEPAFERLAAEHSQDPSNAEEGGDLGYFGAGELVPEFERALDKLDVGEVSGPVRTEFGFHVIRLIDRRERSFEQARSEILGILAEPARDEAWTDWLTRVFAAADVEVNPRYGEFDLATQTVVDATARSVPGAEERPADAATPAAGG